MIRVSAGATLGAAALFLATVALLVGSPGLFYMGTAVIATIIAARLQAFLAVKGLRIERVAPAMVMAGEKVVVEIAVWSEKKIKRPLVMISDHLPARMAVADLTPSLPVAPSYDTPVKSQYSFRVTRRGKYRWSGVTVYGHDALGLSITNQAYRTESTELLVVPTPIAIYSELPIAGGFGLSEAGSGKSTGGIEPRALREYTPGDSLRHVHWRSSARSRTLLVKEFESGSLAKVAIFIQDSQDTDFGGAPLSSLDLICANVSYLARELSRLGTECILPQYESSLTISRGVTRFSEIDKLLAEVEDSSLTDVGMQALACREREKFHVAYFFVSMAQESLVTAIRTFTQAEIPTVVVVYDSRHFLKHNSVKLATDPNFVDELTQAGAKVVPYQFEQASSTEKPEPVGEKVK